MRFVYGMALYVLKYIFKIFFIHIFCVKFYREYLSLLLIRINIVKTTLPSAETFLLMPTIILQSTDHCHFSCLEQGYTMAHTLNKWRSLDFASHWVALATLVIHLLI